MNRLRLLCHLARADFLERVRRRSFLIVLGLTVGAGYLFVPPLDAGYVTLDLDGYRGVYNSAWVGVVIAMLAALTLWFFGFYLVNNAIERDRRTGVGQILAATPLGKGAYVLGKWLSNLLYLGVMVGILAAAALVMQWVRGEVLHVEPWPLLSPFLFVALPVAALVAAVALLFETLPGLGGGLGNAVYFFLSLAALYGASCAGWDLLGVGALEASITAALRAAFPGAGGSFGIGFVPLRGRLADWLASMGYPGPPGELQAFHWPGLTWTPQILLARLAWIGLALGLVLLAALLFDRFDPARDLRPRATRRPGPAGVASPPGLPLGRAASLPAPLTRLAAPARRFRFGRVLLAEVRLMAVQPRWWWYAVLAGLVLACLLASPDQVRGYLLPAAWLWPLLLWSAMGTREARHGTAPLVFAAAHPLRRHFPAAWLAGVIVALLAGGGAALRFTLAGEGPALLAWTVGAMFIPSLALALGVWSRTPQLFEVVYVALWYLGPMNRVAALDFMGVVAGSAAAGVFWYYLGATALLLGLAAAGRWRQVRG